MSYINNTYTLIRADFDCGDLWNDQCGQNDYFRCSIPFVPDTGLIPAVPVTDTGQFNPETFTDY